MAQNCRETFLGTQPQAVPRALLQSSAPRAQSERVDRRGEVQTRGAGKISNSWFCFLFVKKMTTNRVGLDGMNLVVDAFSFFFLFPQVQKHGSQWKVISYSLPGRSENSIKNEWQKILNANRKREIRESQSNLSLNRPPSIANQENPTEDGKD